tara:strand:+ start:721 stop:2010 length:1290 start_codon:yes stop_codon:yes gene_type:complete
MEIEKLDYDIQTFYDYLKINGLDNFEKIKDYLENDKFKLKIKQDDDFPDLINIINTNESNVNIALVRFCNGIIMDKNTLKIKSFTFPKCFEEDSIINNNFLENDIYIEPCYEGTLIKVFSHNNSWIVSTKKMIDSRKSKWISSKNFCELFNETLGGFNLYEKLNPDYCYSFLLCNNENNIVLKYDRNFIIHLNTVDLINNKEIEVIIDENNESILKNHRQILKIDEEKRQKSILEFIQNIKNQQNTLLDYEGFMMINKNYTRQKFRKDNFVKMRSLWGNTNNRFFRYVQLRKNVNDLNLYLKYFPSDKILFQNYENEILDLTTCILNIYRNKFILKEKVSTPFYFKKIIYNLHGDYLKDKVKIKFNDIMVKLLELDDKNLCFIMNKFKKDKNNVVVDSTVANIDNELSVTENITQEQNDSVIDDMEMGT